MEGRRNKGKKRMWVRGQKKEGRPLTTDSLAFVLYEKKKERKGGEK